MTLLCCDPMEFLALTLPPWLQSWVAKAVWSWEHRDTLKFLAAGCVLLLLASIGTRREWGSLLRGLLFMTGIAGVATAGVMGLLGDSARQGPVVIKGDKVIQGPCRKDSDCASGKCRYFEGHRICAR